MSVAVDEATNVAIVRRFIDGSVNGGDISVIEETWAEDMVWHGGSLGTFVGREAYITFISGNVTGAFDGMHLTIYDVIARDDKVVLRFTNSGTNVGPFMGRRATNRHAEWLGIGIYTLRDGRIIEGCSKSRPDVTPTQSRTTRRATEAGPNRRTVVR
jgi:predicted ester cyclase